MKLVDLFAGAGGLSCGLEMAGFKSIFANELVAQYAQTYEYNNPDTRMVRGDIRQVCELNIKSLLGVKKTEVDLIAGGPPCQGFSVNAPVRSLDDERNHLFKDFLRVTAALLPKAVLIENVPGIISLGKGTVVDQIYKELHELGYSVGHRILYAGHYGVPQMRFRTIIIGILNPNTKIRFPKPKYNAQARTNFTGGKELTLKLPEDVGSLKDFTTVWDAISDLPEIFPSSKPSVLSYPCKPQSSYQKILRRNSSKIYNHQCSRIAQINQERLKHIPQGGSWRDIPFDLLPAGLQRARRSDHTKRYGRLDPNSICSTILTKCDPHWGSFFHPEQDRTLSAREAARIQSFPDNFVFLGSLTQQYEQIGNAVPPMMAKAIGAEIKKMIKECYGD